MPSVDTPSTLHSKPPTFDRLRWTFPREVANGFRPALREKETVTAHHQTTNVSVDGIPRGLSYQEFLEWSHEDIRAEWVDGEIVMMSPSSFEHQKLVSFLDRLLGGYVRMNNLGEVLVAPFQMKTGPDLPGREPDLLFVASEHEGRIRDVYLDGPADLVVEVVSPESRGRDRLDKFEEYERGGVPEYWIVEPEEERCLFFVLEEEAYVDRTPESGERFCSTALPGFEMNPSLIWDRPLPDPRELLREFETD